jgi:hypothetical protein
MKVANIKRPKVFIPIILLLVIVLAVILTVRNLNAPAVGTITSQPPAKSEVVDPYSHPNTYDGKYVSFTYPAHYKPIPSPKSGSYLETAGFYGTNQTSKQISVGVLKESINDDSGVKLRQQETDTYTQDPRTASGVMVFSRTANGSERTAFVPHGDKVASISLTAPPGWDLNEDLQTILLSLKWK